MAYITQQNLYDRFGQAEIDALADRDGDGSPDANVVDQAITDAQAEVDSYLAVRYTVPLADPVPDIVKRVTADVARYRLYDDAPSEEVRRRYEEAISWLRKVADGRAAIGIETAGSGGGSVAVVAPAEVFTEDTISRMPQP